MLGLPIGPTKSEIPTFFINTPPRKRAQIIDFLRIHGTLFLLSAADLWRVDSKTDDALRNALPEPFDFFDHWGNVTSVAPSVLVGFYATALLNRKNKQLPTATHELLVNGALTFALSTGYFAVGEYVPQELNKNKSIEKQTPADLTDIAYGTLSALAITGACRRQTIKLAVCEHKSTKNEPPPLGDASLLN